MTNRGLNPKSWEDVLKGMSDDKIRESIERLKMFDRATIGEQYAEITKMIDDGVAYMEHELKRRSMH